MASSALAIVPAPQPAPLAAAEPLGLFAGAIANNPTVAMTATAMVVGGIWGALIGGVGAKIAGGEVPKWIAIGAVGGAFLLGIEGNKQGTELDQWLQQY
jgi:hypothetical protein